MQTAWTDFLILKSPFYQNIDLSASHSRDTQNAIVNRLY